MLQLRRKLKLRENKDSLRVKPIESLERRQLLTAAPSLDGAGVNGTAHTAVIWFDATGDTGSDTVTFQEFDGSSWNNIGTTAGGVHAYVQLTSSLLTGSTTELRAKATHSGVDSVWSNLINVEGTTATPVEPTVENIQTFGSTTDYYFNWTGSTAYRESDTLVVQYATSSSGTGGTVWNDYTTTNATAAGPIDVNGLDFSQPTTMRISVENSNGQSSWNEFTLPALT